MADVTQHDARPNEPVAIPEAAASSPGAAGDHRGRRPATGVGMNVRAADLQPYVGLKYLSRLFKLIAVVLILLLVSEIITLLLNQGTDAIQAVLEEASRLVVFAGLLWGVGDLAILLIDMGHDLRATRILIGRQLAHSMDEQHARVDPGMSDSANDSENTV